jgi:glycosyltransferase involved in cell wall biosynthesis
MAGNDRSLRVLMLIDEVGSMGGAERFAYQLTAHLDPSRFEPTVCLTRPARRPHNFAAIEDLEGRGVEILRLDRSSRAQLDPWRRLIAFMRDRPFDVLHSHKFSSNVWGALIAPRVKVAAFVAHEQTWSYRGKPHRRWLDRYLIARRADAFVAVSSEDRRRMVSIEHVPEGKTRVIYNGVPDPPPPDTARDIRDELGIGSDQPVLGTVAVLRPQKALDVLLRAADILRREFPNLRVLIAGKGVPEAEETRLRRMAAELGLEETVTFLGPREDAVDLMRIFDVAALSSDFEGTPLAVMEYMGIGKPVVATRVGGVPEIVTEGETGLLVEPRQPNALAEAVAKLLRDPELARRMGEAGRERQRQEFSIEASTRKVQDLYEELYAGSARGAGSVA